MSGFNYSNKYYYRYKYYNDNVKYSAQSYQSYNHKYCHRYDYYFLHYKYIEKNDKPFSFEKKEKVVNDTQTDVSKQIVPFKVRSSFQTRNKRPRLMITGKKITKDSGTNTNPKLFNSFDSSMSSIFL